MQQSPVDQFTKSEFFEIVCALVATSTADAIFDRSKCTNKAHRTVVDGKDESMISNGNVSVCGTCIIKKCAEDVRMGLKTQCSDALDAVLGNTQRATAEKVMRDISLEVAKMTTAVSSVKSAKMDSDQEKNYVSLCTNVCALAAVLRENAEPEIYREIAAMLRTSMNVNRARLTVKGQSETDKLIFSIS